MTEAELLEKLQRIEALFAGTTFEGERIAAATAREKLRAKLAEVTKLDPPREQRVTLPDIWSTKLFVALLRRYDLRPYRHRGQRRTTVMVMVPQKFFDETLWPEMNELFETLQGYLLEVTERVIAQAIHPDATELGEAPKALPSG
jgi:hypothetical protein